MRFMTDEECVDWYKGRAISLPDRTAIAFHHMIQIEDWHSFALAQGIIENMNAREEMLLWITEWKIWPSSENWHLYYALRQMSGDRELLANAPGHFFLAHEMEELKTMLQLALLNGWGGYVLAATGNVQAFFSHDRYIDFHAEKDEMLEPIRKRFKVSD